MSNQLCVNKSRLCKKIDRLAKIGAVEGNGVNRLALSNENKEARDLVVAWMKKLDMTVQVDEIGNIIGVREGMTDAAPAMTGSHLDTVGPGGRFDGALGVLAGLEAVNSLNDQNIRTRRPVAVTVFTNEEGVRYTPDMMGSLAYSGGLPIEEALLIRGTDGTLFGEELDRIGYAGPMKCGAIKPYAYVELHVEQGPVLYRKHICIGAVKSVMGISWQEITITGKPNHAGTTPGDLRHDAGLVAAKIITFLRDLIGSFGENMRATCGKIRFYPDMINVIPGKTVITVDLRNSDEMFLEAAEQHLAAYVREVSAQEGVVAAFHQLVRLKPVHFNTNVVEIVRQKAKGLGYRSCRMLSGAGHDAQMMASLCPAVMIFVPSKDGISHCPSEYTKPGDLEKGANVLLNTLVHLADQHDEL